MGCWRYGSWWPEIGMEAVDLGAAGGGSSRDERWGRSKGAVVVDCTGEDGRQNKELKQACRGPSKRIGVVTRFISYYKRASFFLRISMCNNRGSGLRVI
jgi:hypothetical protein